MGSGSGRPELDVDDEVVDVLLEVGPGEADDEEVEALEEVEVKEVGMGTGRLMLDELLALAEADAEEEPDEEDEAAGCGAEVEVAPAGESLGAEPELVCESGSEPPPGLGWSAGSACAEPGWPPAWPEPAPSRSTCSKPPAGV